MPIYEDQYFKDYVNSLPAATENDLTAGNNMPLVRSSDVKKLAAEVVAGTTDEMWLRYSVDKHHLDGVKRKTARIYGVEPLQEFVIKLSKTSWEYETTGTYAVFQIYYYNGTSNVIVEDVLETNGVLNKDIKSEYRIFNRSSYNAQYWGVYVAATADADIWVNVEKADDSIICPGYIEGKGSAGVYNSIRNLQKGRYYKLELLTDEYSNQQTTTANQLVFELSKGANTIYEIRKGTTFPSSIFFLAADGGDYGIFCRCDTGKKLKMIITDVTADLTTIDDNFIFNPGYCDARNGNITTSTVNSHTYFHVGGFGFIDVVMGWAPGSTDAGICFYDKDYKFISGVKSDSGATARTYKHYLINVPDNAIYARATIYTEFIQNFSVRGIPKAVGTFVRNQNNFKAFWLGSPQVYISGSTSDGYENLNYVHTSELYSQYDALVSAHPNFFKRKSDLATLTRIDDGEQFIIRSYELNFSGRVLFDHEPGNDEVVTTSNNKWLTNYNPRKILINGGMHGEEKTPCWGLMLAIKEILESSEKWASYIRDNFVLEIIPCLNPAGWDLNRRGNCNNKVLNRAEAATEPETLAYMDWIADNKDAFVLIDVHGTQGRFAYTPVAKNMPLHDLVVAFTSKLSSMLYNSNKAFYEGQYEGYGTTYAPFLIAKDSGDDLWDRSRLACRMFQDYGMQEFALETPDNLFNGAIGSNDKRNCKITKELVINFLQFFGSIHKLPL